MRWKKAHKSKQRRRQQKPKPQPSMPRVYGLRAALKHGLVYFGDVPEFRNEFLDQLMRGRRYDKDDLKDDSFSWAGYENSDPRADMEAVFDSMLNSETMPSFLKDTVRRFRTEILGPDPIVIEGEH